MSTMPVKRVALIARLKLPQALSTLADAAEWLAAHGSTPVIEADSARAAGLDTRWTTAPRESFADGVDAVLAFGGDGTLLEAAGVVAHGASDAPMHRRQPGTTRLPDGGRSLGTDGDARRPVHGRGRIETRVMLEGRVESRGGQPTERLALERHRRDAQRVVAHDRDGHHGGRPVRLRGEGRRAHRRHGHRFDGVQPVGRRPDRAPVGGRARAHAHRAAHADTSPARVAGLSRHHLAAENRRAGRRHRDVRRPVRRPPRPPATWYTSAARNARCACSARRLGPTSRCCERS